MGNRANVVFVAGERISPCIYLHWNGGPESVYSMLEELDRRGVRADAEYEAARFVQLYGEFMDGRKRLGGLSLGIMAGPKEITPEGLGEVFTDTGDNGFYVIDRSERTVRRFTIEGPTWDKLLEWEAASVNAELDEWRRDPTGYRAAILDQFAAWTRGWESDHGTTAELNYFTMNPMRAAVAA